MNVLRSGASALGKLLILAALAGAFFAGMGGVVWLSLRGAEVKVPELVGKSFYDSEKEMDALGLKLKRQATRYSEEKPNTVLEQLPKPGDTVKTGQTILVVLSEPNPEGNEAPATIKKEDVNTEDDTQGTDVAPDKPAKSNKNANVKKPSQTTRDVISNKSNKNTNSSTDDADKPANSKSSANDSGDKNSGNKNSSAPSTNKTTPATNSTKPDAAKPAAAKTPVKSPVTGSGDTRSRKTP